MFKNVLIIGCGLIGSSIARAIRSKKISKNIYIFEKSKKNISVIKKLKMNFKIIKNLNKIDSNLNLIILCTPMSEYKNIMKKIKNLVSNNTIVTDVGSTKNFMNHKIKRTINIKKLSWIPSHPIAGSEVSGAQYGNKNLFQNKWCIVIKEKGTNKKHLSILKTFWNKIGSNVVLMNPTKHDFIFSITSHLPHLIAYNLVKTATDFEKGEENKIIKYSAGGLRDFSRIAASNEIMWRDVFFTNKKNMVLAINKFIKNLRLFKADIVNENNKILKKLIDSKKVRKKIISLKQDVDKPDFGRSN